MRQIEDALFFYMKGRNKMKIKWTELSVLEQEALVKYYTNRKAVNAYLLCYKNIDTAIKELAKIFPEYLQVKLENEIDGDVYQYYYTEKETVPVIKHLCKENRYFEKEYDSLEEFCAADTRMAYIPKQFVTEELMCINARNNNCALSYMDKSDVTKKVIMAALECKYNNVTTYLHLFVDLFDEEELTKIILECRGAVNEIPKERWTKKMLYAYLEHLVRNNIVPDLDYQCKLPEELKDKVYWRSMCMLHGYYYSLIPEELKDTVIIPKLIQATIERWDKRQHTTGYNGMDWMLGSLPKKYITEDLQIQVCIRNPAAIRHVKEQNGKITEGFCEKLEKYGSLDFLYWMEDKDLPEKYKKIKMNQMLRNRFSSSEAFCSKKHSKEEWEIYIRYHGECIDKVPNAYLSENMCLDAMRANSFAALSKIPEEFKTEHFWETVVKERIYNKPVHVPEKYLTKEEVISFINEHHLQEEKDIPVNYRTEDVLLNLVSVPNNIYISKESQTQAIVDKAVNTATTPYTKVFVLSKCKRCLWRDDVVTDLCRFCKNTILLADKGLTKEQLDVSIKTFPENILRAPLWYKEIIRKEGGLFAEIESAEKNTCEHHENIDLDVIEIENFTQISLWDL